VSTGSGPVVPSAVTADHKAPPGERRMASPGWNLLSGVFGDPLMGQIFSETGTVASWLEVERALATAQAQVGVISSDDAEAIARAAVLGSIDRDRLWEHTRNVGYPVLPLVHMLSAALPAGPNGRVHYGATTQDIMDTALVLQLGRAMDRMEELLSSLGDLIADLVEQHVWTIMAARTHGQQAVPTTFGAKLAVVLAECTRNRERLGQLRPRISKVSLFGAGGTSASLGTAARSVRAAMAAELGLGVDDVPWHVARDGLAEFAAVCALVSGTAGRLAREVIELSRTEIREVAEAEGHLRGASSTMPQKANPISSEVIVGMSSLAGVLASAVFGAMRPTHERSAGDWQAEWQAVPELAVLAGSSLHHAVDVVHGLRVFPGAMAANLAADGGLVIAEAYMMRLAPLLGRDASHTLVYEASKECRLSGETLFEVLRRKVPQDAADAVRLLGKAIDAADYLGDVAVTCEVAVAQWRNLPTALQRAQAGTESDRP